uniref:Uncharacterized protein n=1 Tax=Branchiostoma floridae TaxID=7739 RepID=C3YCZ9_BRAFL|eukprot:XP_002605940.1 hypothetical protein BRAFLDRAFT_87382 [Branchiostoma floridae]
MAAQGSSRVPQDISENVRAVLGKGVKVGMKKLIKVQTGSKEETKVLALSQSRAFILSAKVPSKLHIEAEDKRNIFKPIEAEDAEHIIGHIGVSLKRTFPDIPRPLHTLLPSLLIEPAERMKNVQRAVDAMGSKEKGPCGGFSAMYTCMCDFHNLPVREEVIWDVDTIYLSQANRELCLDDFNHMDSKDLGPIISALEHNTWFTKLSSYHTRLAEHSEQLCKVMKKNTKLEELVLENAGLNKEFAKHMATALLSNTNVALHTVSLSHNHLEDRGVSHLALQLMSTSQSLKQLHLADNMFKAEDILSEKIAFREEGHIALSGQAITMPRRKLRHDGQFKANNRPWNKGLKFREHKGTRPTYPRPTEDDFALLEERDRQGNANICKRDVIREERRPMLLRPTPSQATCGQMSPYLEDGPGEDGDQVLGYRIWHAGLAVQACAKAQREHDSQEGVLCKELVRASSTGEDAWCYLIVKVIRVRIGICMFPLSHTQATCGQMSPYLEDGPGEDGDQVLGYRIWHAGLAVQACAKAQREHDSQEGVLCKELVRASSTGEGKKGLATSQTLVCDGCGYKSAKENFYEEVARDGPGGRAAVPNAALQIALADNPMGVTAFREMAAAMDLPVPSEASLQEGANRYSDLMTAVNANDMKRWAKVVKRINVLKGNEADSPITGQADTRKSKEPVIASASFKEFFLNCQSLKHLSLSGTRLPPDAVKSLFLGLSGNFVLRDVHVDLSSCELKKTGGEMLESTIANVPCISSLDISDNGFDEHMETMLSWIGQNKAIRHLNISRNFSGIRPRHLPRALESVKRLIQEDNSSIDSLCLADSKLKENLIPILNVLGSNNSLTSLDISGNGMGDFGARMLSKALQINSKLRNHTLQNMPTPVSDASQALRMDEAGTEEALQKIETLLLRNQRPLKMTSDRIYRLQQGVLITTAQQMVEQLSRKVQDIRAVLKDSKSPQVQAALQESDRLISDADNSKQLLPLLYKQGSGAEGEGEPHPLETKLGSLTKQMQEETDRHMASSVDNVLKYGEQQCPHILQTQGLKQALEQECQEKSKLPDKLVEEAIVNQAGTTILNKVRENQLHIATFVSDKVIEELLESLAKNHATLQNIAQNHVEPVYATPSKRPPEPEKADDSPVPQSPAASPTETRENQVLTPSPQLSPKIDNKRKSVVKRMQRPMSIMGEETIHFDLSSGSDEDQMGRQAISSVEEDLYEEIEPGAKAEEPTQPVAPSRKSRRKPEKSSSTGSTSSNDVSELPTEGGRLEHITKGRIKAPKNAGMRRRPVPNRGVPNSVENSPEGTMDAGLDDFFEKKALDVALSEEPAHAVNGEKSPPAASSSLQKDNSQKKKKKSMFPQFLKKSPSRAKEKSPEVNRKKSLEKSRQPAAGPQSPPPVKEEREDRSSPEQTDTKPTAIQEEEEEKMEDTEKAEEQPAPEGKPRSSDAEENSADDTAEDSEDGPAVPEPVALRRPAGIPKGIPGISGGLLAEMKKRQEKRATMLPPPEMSAASSPVQDTSTSPSVSPGSIRRREEKNTAASPSLEPKPSTSPSIPRRHNKDDGPSTPTEGRAPPKPAKRRSRDSANLEPNGPSTPTDPSKSPTSPLKEDANEKNRIAPAVKPKPPATRPKPLAKPKVPIRPKSAEVGKLLLEESGKKPDPLERQLPPRAAASAEKINMPKAVDVKDDTKDAPQGKAEEETKDDTSPDDDDATDSSLSIEVPKVCVEKLEDTPKTEGSGDASNVKGQEVAVPSMHQRTASNGNPAESEDSPAASAPAKRPSVMDRIKSFSGKDDDVPMKAKSRSLPRDLDTTAEAPEPAGIPRSQSMDSADKLKPANGEKSKKEEDLAKDDGKKESEETQVMV